MYYIYNEKRQSNSTWIKIICAIICIVALITLLLSYNIFSNKFETFKRTISDMKVKEVYYKNIEKQFFDKKTIGIVNEGYEKKLKEKEDYIEEISNQSAKLENTIRKIASTADIKPRNYREPEQIDRGSYDRINRDNTKNMTYEGEWLMTMYAPTKEECGNDKGITASGKPVQPGYNIAIDPKYWKFGQKFYIEGYGEVIATDTGSAIKGKMRLDYCVLDPKIAKQFGAKRIKVWAINE